MLPEISIFNFSLEGWDKRKGKWQGGWAIILNISVKGGRLFEGGNQSLAKKIYIYISFHNQSTVLGRLKIAKSVLNCLFKRKS